MANETALLAFSYNRRCKFFLNEVGYTRSVYTYSS